MDLSRAMLNDFDDALPIRDILRNVWFNAFNYISNNLKYYQFVEQFANSPYSELVDREALEKHYIPLIEVLQRGIAQKIIKDVDCNLLAAFLFHPLSYLSNPRLCNDWQLSEDELESAFTMAWDAIKLYFFCNHQKTNIRLY
jgi:hypothetical protein